MAENRVRTLVQFGLYAVLIAIPFELPNRQTIPVEMPTFATALFLATTVLQPRRCYGRIPTAVWPFFAFLCAVALATSVNFLNDAGEVMHVFLLHLQSVLFFWAAANLLTDETVADRALLVFAGACLLRAALPLIGFGRTATVVWTGGERLTAFGQNENNAAMILGAGLIVLLGLGYARARVLIRPRLLLLLPCAIIAYAVVETGSRGGLLALFAGLMTLFLTRRETIWARIRSVSLGLLMLALMGVAAYQAPVMRNRLSETAHSGALAGRDVLYPLLGEMFMEKPVLGWGPMNNQYELSLREGNSRLVRRDSHNIILETLTSTGLIGTLIFCLGMLLCCRAAWQARARPEGILPIALFVLVFVANMSGNWIASKLVWFAFAYAIASAKRPPLAAVPI